MKIWIMALMFFISFSSHAMAAQYCEALKKAGLEGKFVIINPEDGGERNFTHGVVVSVEPEILVVQTGDSTSYVNCDHIHSVVYTKSAQGEETKIEK